MTRFAVVSAGFAYTDVVASVDAAFLDRHGLQAKAIDLVSAETLNRLQRELKDPAILPGGASANTASVVAALGGKAGYFGKVGMDTTGDLFLAAFRRVGVDLCCRATDHQATPSATCMILLAEDGDRSMVYNPGGAENFMASDFKNFDFSSSDFFLIESQLLSSARAAPILRRAVEQAQGKTRVVINLQEIQNRQPFQSLLPWIASHADILIGNEAEHAAIEQLIKLPQAPGQILVKTKGSDGAEAWSDAAHYRVPASKPEKIVDTVGAGDAFSAGFLFALSQGRDIEASLTCGSRVASTMLGESGGRPGTSLAHLGLV